MMLEGTTGGIRKHVVDLLLGLQARGHALCLIYSPRRADETFRQSLPTLAARGIELRSVELDNALHPLEDARGFFAAVGAIRAFRPDVAHAHGAKAGFLLRPAAWMCGVRTIVYNPHGGSFHKFSQRLGGVYLLAERLLSLFRQTYIGVSHHGRQQIIDALRVPPEHVHLIHNGIDLAEYPRAERPAGARDDLIVLYPALFLDNKGHLEFLDAIERAPARLSRRVRIWLAGEGPLGPAIAQRIKALRLDGSVTMLGFVTDIVSLFKQCDLVLLPSRNEVFGYVAVEALAIGRPVIATDVGGLRDIVQDGVNGRVVPLERLEQIVEILNHYAEDRAALAALAPDGRDRLAALFGTQAMVEKTERAYGAV